MLGKGGGNLQFTYKARDIKGHAVDGTMDADNRAIVIERLRQQSLIPVSITEGISGKAAAAALERVPKARKISVKELSLLSRQLATMIQAGLPLVSAMNVLTQQIDKKSVAAVMNDIRRRVEGGEAFSNAIKNYPGIFPPMFSSLVEAGETAGALDNVLDRTARYYENSSKTISKVKGALAYPLFLVGVAVVAVAALMIFVLPAFIDLFKSFDAELPTITKIVFGTAELIRKRWYIIAAVIAGLVFSLRWLFTKSMKPQFDTFILKVPVIGPVIKKSNTAMFARTFAMMVQSGVPMLQGLEMLERTAGNYVMKKNIESARLGVKEGSGLGKPLKQSTIFPPMLGHMVAIGEETGALDSMLEKVADFYEEETDMAIKAMTSMIEPIMILGIGVLAAFLVASIMVPMFSIASFV